MSTRRTAFPFLRMQRGDAPPDASTLGVTVSALNVGMPQNDSFAKSGKQDRKVAELVDIVLGWFDDTPGPAVVGLNEIAPVIEEKLVALLEARRPNAVGSAASETDCLLWRAPHGLSLRLSLLDYFLTKN